MITGGASGIGLQFVHDFLTLNKQNFVSVIDKVIPDKVKNDLIMKFSQERLLFINLDVTSK